MRVRPLGVTLLALTVLGAGSGVAGSSTNVAVKKQRIAIEGVFDVGTGTGTWKLIPLTPGPLGKDSGTFRAVSSGLPIDPTVLVKNGQTIELVSGGDQMTGKRGTLSISQRLQLFPAGGSYKALTGTWVLNGGTGVYERLSGGGGFAAVLLPSGKSRLREEGFVRAG
jgi:hypothetical protein